MGFVEDAKISPKYNKKNKCWREGEPHPLNKGDPLSPTLVDVADSEYVLRTRNWSNHAADVARPGHAEEQRFNEGIVGIKAPDDWQGERKDQRSGRYIG